MGRSTDNHARKDKRQTRMKEAENKERETDSMGRWQEIKIRRKSKGGVGASQL